MKKSTIVEKLRRLADYVERRQRAKPKAGYAQDRVTHNCGAPACMIGHAQVLFGPGPATALSQALFYVPSVPRTGADNGYNTAQGELFGGSGCDDAREDWRKAVSYVREWCDKYEAQA